MADPTYDFAVAVVAVALADDSVALVVAVDQADDFVALAVAIVPEVAVPFHVAAGCADA